MTDDENNVLTKEAEGISLALPAHVPDRMASESDKGRIARLHEFIRNADFDRRRLHPEQVELLKLTDDDAELPDRAVGLQRIHDMRWSQLGLVWNVLAKTNIHHQFVENLPVDQQWSASKAVAIACAHAQPVADWLKTLPDVDRYVERFGPEWKDTQGWFVSEVAHVHPIAKDMPHAKYAIRHVIEHGMRFAADLIWCGLHPSATDLQPLVEALCAAMVAYGRGRDRRDWLRILPHYVNMPRPFTDLPPPLAYIGSKIDMWSQATGISIDNPTGVRASFLRAAELGWKAPRSMLA